jgi:hypothetical protein
LLGGSESGNAPALIIPFSEPDGRPIPLNHYCVVRPDRPKQFDGRRRKYLNPRGEAPRLYIPPLPATLAALQDENATLVVVEGPLKSIAVAQADIPCIGLIGNNTWSIPQTDEEKAEKRPRRLRDYWHELRPRNFAIMFDSDSPRIHASNREAAHLARALRGCGRNVRILTLPLEERCAGGLLKMGPDDVIEWWWRCYYAQKYGVERALAMAQRRFRDWFAAQLGPAAEVDWQVCRQEVRAQRIGLETLDNSERIGYYFSGAPCGIGKSTADILAIKETLEMTSDPTSQRTSLTVVPTHKDCSETVGRFAKEGIEAVAFPKFDEQSCLNFGEASAALHYGLSFKLGVCPECPYKHECDYLRQFAAAQNARHAAATHERMHYMQEELTKGRDTIMIHENATDAACPTIEVDGGLRWVMMACDEAARRCIEKHHDFYVKMEHLAERLHKQLETYKQSAEVYPLPEPQRQHGPRGPAGMHKLLAQCVGRLGLKVKDKIADAMRLVLALTLGQVQSLFVGVDELKAAGGDPKLLRRYVAVLRHGDFGSSTVIFEDATTTAAELEAILKKPVTDITPKGKPKLLKDAYQVLPAKDVTIRRKPEQVIPILRGLLHDLPYERIVLITHQHIAKALKEQPPLLESRYRRKLARVVYFGGGAERGSDLHLEWDCIVILGTPRVSPVAIRRRLMQRDRRRALRLTSKEAGWSKDWWSGVTVDGRRVVVDGLWHYTDRDWDMAYHSIVVSELWQCIGRARGILPEGIPCFVVTRENLAPVDQEDGIHGLPLLSDRPFPEITDAQQRVIDAMFDEDGYCRGTAVAMRQLGISRQMLSRQLKSLKEAKRVKHCGYGRWELQTINMSTRS